MTANFWRSTGIVTLFDADANILAQEELIPGSNHLQTVNWRGDGQEFAMLNANTREGGMVDGQLRRVVMFSNDGHPELTYQVLDVMGDERDEIVVWDQLAGSGTVSICARRRLSSLARTGGRWRIR